MTTGTNNKSKKNIEEIDKFISEAKSFIESNTRNKSTIMNNENESVNEQHSIIIADDDINRFIKVVTGSGINETSSFINKN